MTLQEVKDGVERVRGVAGDFEAAHSAEDELHKAVLTAISLGRCADAPPEDFAAEAIRTAAIDFARCCA